MQPFRLPLLVLLGLLIAGCVRGPMFIPAAQRKPIDRALVDYPGGFALKEVLHNLTGPIDFEEDEEGNWIVAESGRGGFSPRIFRFNPKDGTTSYIYPTGRAVKVPDVAPFNLIKTGFHIYGPIGGIAVEKGKVYVTHRDKNGFGAVTAFNYDGTHATITSGLPAQGDNGMSDIAISPVNGRLYFAVGSATNSGVVGLDNWQWVKLFPDFCDRSFYNLKLTGFHGKSKNPDAGLFGGPEVAVTAPFQPFNVSTQTRIRKVDTPTGAIYSADPTGGGMRVEAHGIRCPRGLAFNQFATLYFTANGMELRGTRPIADDPDALLWFSKDAWYGFPDYSTDLQPIVEPRFQPKGEMQRLLIASGYDEITFLLDHQASNNNESLMAPLRNTLLQSTFPSLSGAANFDFVPAGGAMSESQGDVIVPLFGDRYPFATSGFKLHDRVGFKVVRVDAAKREVVDLIRNTRGGPASALGRGEGVIERPVAVKFGRDGALYIVDFGEARHNSSREKIKPHTGRVFKLEPLPGATSKPTTTTRPSAIVVSPQQ
jgi:glucose/arabinose dehydrogenase